MAALKSVVFLHLEMTQHLDYILELLLRAKSEGTLSRETAPTAIIYYIVRMKRKLKKDGKMAMIC